jgi:SPX domain protein involved in polyphosphate accumulation
LYPSVLTFSVDSNFDGQHLPCSLCISKPNVEKFANVNPTFSHLLRPHDKVATEYAKAVSQRSLRLQELSSAIDDGSVSATDVVSHISCIIRDAMTDAVGRSTSQPVSVTHTNTVPWWCEN